MSCIVSYEHFMLTPPPLVVAVVLLGWFCSFYPYFTCLSDCHFNSCHSKVCLCV